MGTPGEPGLPGNEGAVVEPEGKTEAGASQATPAAKVADYVALARAAGLDKAEWAADETEFDRLFLTALAGGPNFIAARIDDKPGVGTTDQSAAWGQWQIARFARSDHRNESQGFGTRAQNTVDLPPSCDHDIPIEILTCAARLRLHESSPTCDHRDPLIICGSVLGPDEIPHRYGVDGVPRFADHLIAIFLAVIHADDDPVPQPLARRGEYYAIEEAGHRLVVNFSDYLDTGLFLDHRITRARLGQAAAGRRFLNLFCYTATATVYAAAGGATRTLSVDMSATYLDWAARNFSANGLDRGAHELLQANCLSWLEGASPTAWDLIFLDPPTFSNSARMQGVLDTQRDHARLIGQCMRLLAPGGLLVFSTNAQRFRLDAAVGEQWAVEDISAATLPFDFRRNERIHRAYEIRPRG